MQNTFSFFLLLSRNYMIIIAFEFYMLSNYVCLAYLHLLCHQMICWVVIAREDLLIFFLQQKC